MTEKEKQTITKLRNEGYGYTRIGKALDISANTIKTFCIRNGLNGVRGKEPPKISAPSIGGRITCLNCGVPVAQNEGRKEKKFCSDRCRNMWWNKHLDLVNRKANYEFVCPVCKKPFTVYGNSHRKYCCHECYIADRFGGKHNE